MSTITRRLSAEEIQAVATAFNDQRAIKLLKAIRDNIVQEADLKQEGKGKEGAGAGDVKDEKQKEELALQQQEERAFVGMAREDKILGGSGAKEGEGEGKEGEEETAGQKSTLERLENLGLISKGGYIPKDKERINGYKLTNEGYALLTAALEREEGATNKGGEGGAKSTSKSSNYSSNSAEVPDDSDNYKKKQQQVGEFKSGFNKEYK